MACSPEMLNQLKDWWSVFESVNKQFVNLNDEGVIVLNATTFSPERKIFNPEPQTVMATFHQYEDRFKEFETRVEDLEKQWGEEEDKTKLAQKIKRLWDVGQHHSSIGHYEPLFKKLATWGQVAAALEEEMDKKREALLEQAEALVKTDDWKENTQQLKELTKQWKDIGNPQAGKGQELWEKFDQLRDNFFERKHQNYIEQESEMMQNMDFKLELVEKAEALANSDDWKNTSELFTHLMDDWKNIGRTLHDKNEEYWTRFNTARQTFYDNKKIHHESIQVEQDKNYEVKLELVKEAEGLKDSTEWGKTTKAYAGIMEKWKQTGRVPKEKSDEIWNQFNAAKDHFFAAKRSHFETRKKAEQENLLLKQELLVRAEMLKTSRHWHDTTVEMNQLMEEWKSIGPVPREQSDKVWTQFLAARKEFFKRKDEDREKKKERRAFHKEWQEKQTVKKAVNLNDELAEEVEKLKDFEQALLDTTSGPKVEELKAHLTNLIQETKVKIEKLTTKLEKLKTPKKIR